MRLGDSRRRTRLTFRALVLLGATVPILACQGPQSNDRRLAPRACSGIEVEGGAGLRATVQVHPPGTRFCLNGSFQLGEPVVLKADQELIGPATITARAGGNRHDGLVAHSGTRIESLDISGFRIGIRTLGDEIDVRANLVHSNSRSGIGGPGNHTVIEGNEIFDNGSTEYFRCCAAGIKYVGVGVVVRDNSVHDNTHGVWADQDADRTLVVGNEVRNNQYKGIFVEVSAMAVVRGNVVTGNNHQGADRGGGIAIHSSQGIRVFGNDLGDNGSFGIRVSEDLEREPSENVVISDNKLNGDELGGCEISECFNNA